MEAGGRPRPLKGSTTTSNWRAKSPGIVRKAGERQKQAIFSLTLSSLKVRAGLVNLTEQKLLPMQVLELDTPPRQP